MRSFLMYVREGILGALLGFITGGIVGWVIGFIVFSLFVPDDGTVPTGQAAVLCAGLVAVLGVIPGIAVGLVLMRRMLVSLEQSVSLPFSDDPQTWPPAPTRS